jgi:hypothetical protein
LNDTLIICGYCFTAFALGGLVSLAELLSRYKWTLREIGRSSAGWSYLGLSGAAALVAYLLAVDWELDLGLKDKNEIWRVLAVASLGMVVLRSSFANLRIGDKDFPAGPAAILEFAMSRAEKSLDRKLALERWESLRSVVDGLTYAATRNYLMAVSEGTLRSLSSKEIVTIRADVEKIDKLEVDDVTKMKLFAFRLTEDISLELFKSFATAAKVELAAANQLAAKQVSKSLQRLAEIKKTLTP